MRDLHCRVPTKAVIPTLLVGHLSALHGLQTGGTPGCEVYVTFFVSMRERQGKNC
jgi:hypothetical protein